MMIDNIQEGYIKFKSHFERERIEIPAELFIPLNYWRNFLRNKGWIGSYPDGVGFGNISIRIPESNQFYITGSATGSFADLTAEQYTLVEKCDPAMNMIWCKGLINASAESMSHFMIYETIPKALAVVHIHNRLLWDKYINVSPTTAKEVSYGTPEMAYEIQRILKLPEMKLKNVLVMGGHEEGIISFGNSIEDAVKAMLELEN
jgi:L-ribulose-5-phosphate 4-epimerase